MTHSSLRIVPLGGLGEIGMNCLALDDEGDILVVDCGITFPHDDLGIDTLHPRFDWLVANRDRVRGLFLTHGHEDHVGAVPYFLSLLDVPVWGPPHALAIAKHRIDDRTPDLRRPRLIPTEPGQRYRVGRFVVEPIHVTHSIVEATSLAIETSLGTIIHTGDFKLDPTPPDGRPTDEARFRALGDAGVALLMSDSTNIDARGEPGSESAVGDELARVVGESRGRVVVGTFASNLHRLRMLGDVAKATRRKLALFGRSVQLQAQWGRELGHLDWPSDLVVPPAEAKQLPRHRLLALASGTQAEPNSSLTRLARGTYPHLALEEGDTVVYSARIIPGNDLGVYDVMAAYLRRGVIVRSWATDPGVHVSGHAHRSEQSRMLQMVRPRAFVPLHGTRHHLERHAALAREHGVPDVLVLENGEVGELSERGLAKAERVVSGRVATWDGQEIPESALAERAMLGRSGVVHVTLVVAERALTEPPRVTTSGLYAQGELAAEERAIAKAVAAAFAEASFHVYRATDEAVADVAKGAARRAVEAATGKKPVALVTVLRR